MKKSFLVIPLLGIALESCNIAQTIDASTQAIHCNREAVEESTRAVYRNLEAVEESSKTIDENKRLIEEMSKS